MSGMAEDKKPVPAKKDEKKKVRTREQESRNFRILYTVIWPFYNIPFPIRTLHRERIPDGACIICPNHNSNLDPPMACFAVTKKHPMRIMAKKSLMEIPVVGKIFDAAGTFGVDRGNADIGAIKKALKVLKDGYPLLMFPEGTRVKADTQGQAKTGAVMLAMKTGAPLVPMFMTRKKRVFRRTTIVIGEPYVIRPAGKRPTGAELEAAANELLRRIYALEEESK